MNLVSQTELAALLGVSQPAIAKRVGLGRLTYADPARKLFDEVAARAQWAAHRERFRASTTAPAGDQLTARERRDLAEAQLAELALREKTGELVRQAEVSGETFTIFRTLRDRMEGVADRIAAILAAESDAGKVHALLSSEIKSALREVAEGLAGAPPDVEIK